MLNYGAYLCGPTTDHRQHIGNFRTMVGSLNHYLTHRRLKRCLYRSKRVYFKAPLVMNFTDLAESVITCSRENGLAYMDQVNLRVRETLLTLTRMGCRPWSIKTVRCSSRMKIMKNMLLKLIKGKKNVEYTPSGLVYYPEDRPRSEGFHLWRTGLHLENQVVKGGIAGWHYECAHIIGSYFNKNFIHYGGLDLKAIHHHNEQILLKDFYRKYCRYWFHCNPVTTDGKKMSKSLGNGVYPSGSPIALRNYLLRLPMGHTLSFNEQAFREASNLKSELLRETPHRAKKLWDLRFKLRKARMYRRADLLKLKLIKLIGLNHYIRDGPEDSTLIYKPICRY